MVMQSTSNLTFPQNIGTQPVMVEDDRHWWKRKPRPEIVLSLRMKERVFGSVSLPAFGGSHDVIC